MVSRREWLGKSLGAAAGLALTPQLLRALEKSGALIPQGGKLVMRAIPSSGEMVPAVGLSISNHPGFSDPAVQTQILRLFAENGGRVYDVMHVNPANEQFHIDAANQLGIADKLFWSMRANPANEAPAADLVKPHIAKQLERTKKSKIDLAMLPVKSDAATIAALKDEKKAGRVKYIGVQTIVVSAQAAELEAIMRNEPIDFIGIDYDVSNRFAEERILPLAQERKIGVVAFFPFNNAQGLSCTGSTSLFDRTGTKPLPDWAAEFDAKTWAQFFIKYVISHPAITVARAGTTKVNHLLDDVGGGMGRLPDEATRRKMAALIDSLPPAASRGRGGPPPVAPGITLAPAILDRYVGEYKAASGFTVTISRGGPGLMIKPGNNPEAPFLARSETRFQDARGPFFEFQLDASGKVTGVILEQNGPQGVQKILLERKP
jgi:aryl-alcohol dehydrogenase-like predicted oxidoreductase